MGRKSRHTDVALINAGIELIRQGNYEPTVRAICTLANVNQGMFVYYFGFKEEYMKILFSKIYDDFYEHIFGEEDENQPAIERIKTSCYKLAKYYADNLYFALFLTTSILEYKATAFFMDYRVPHFIQFRTLIEQAQKDGSIASDLNTYEVYIAIHTILVQPIIIRNKIIKMHGTDNPVKKLLNIDVHSEESIQKRLRVVFKGLTP